MAKKTPNLHEEDLRIDLEALLKAGRELGTDMDRALVDSYLERQRTAIQQTGRAAPQEQPTSVRQPGRATSAAGADVGDGAGGGRGDRRVLARVDALVDLPPVLDFWWLATVGGGYRYRMPVPRPQDDWRSHELNSRSDDAGRPVDYI